MIYQSAHQLPVFKAVPVLRILIPFIIGIIIGLLGVKSYEFVMLTSLSFVVFLLTYKMLFHYINYQMLFNVIFLWMGYLHVNTHRENLYYNHFSKINSKKCTLVLNAIPEIKSKSVKVFANVIRVDNNGTSGQILLYLAKDSLSMQLNYGDELKVVLNAKSIQNIPNSNFDYKQYLANKQIFNQAYLKSNEWSLIRHHCGNAVVCLAYQYRKQCVAVLQKSMNIKEAFAVAAALLIGDDDAIPKSVYQVYTDSGTLHVLSVSGMHVGVIYFLLVSLFGRMEKNKLLKHFYFSSILIFIWMYSVLSGSSASVFRAATMLTVVIIGKWVNGNSPIYNSLVLSMFFLLLYNPFYLTDKGFILSYLAVYGIVYLQPKVLFMWNPKQSWLFKLWEFTSVSIAAQLMTLPVSLYLFGKFPNYFILANWVVIPLSTLAIYLTIAQLIFCQVEWLSGILTIVNEKIICFMNDFLKNLTNCNGAVTYNLTITITQCIIGYLLLFVFFHWMTTKKFTSLITFLGLYSFLLMMNIMTTLG
ncbi:MAG: ComEC/Rec2 family competence protein [Bacteroidota bacterium]